MRLAIKAKIRMRMGSANNESMGCEGRIQGLGRALWILHRPCYLMRHTELHREDTPTALGACVVRCPRWLSWLCPPPPLTTVAPKLDGSNTSCGSDKGVVCVRRETTPAATDAS